MFDLRHKPIVVLIWPCTRSHTAFSSNRISWCAYPRERMTSHVELQNVIGHGTYGRVYLARFQGKLVAVKSVRVHNNDKKLLNIVRAEISTLRTLKHDNIIQLIDVLSAPENLQVNFVMEFAPCGDLRRHIDVKGALPEQDAAWFFIQLSAAIKHAHTHHVIHRDIKLENILIGLNGVVKLADWGYSASWSPVKRMTDSFGSLAYASPEILNGESYSGNFQLLHSQK